MMKAYANCQTFSSLCSVTQPWNISNAGNDVFLLIQENLGKKYCLSCALNYMVPGFMLPLLGKIEQQSAS